MSDNRLNDPNSTLCPTPSVEEIVSWAEKEFLLTKTRIPGKKIAAQFGLKYAGSKYQAAILKLRNKGWNGQRYDTGNGAGYGDPQLLGEKRTKTLVKKAKAKAETPAIVPYEEEGPSGGDTLRREMYYNHVRNLFDEMRASSEDPSLSDFHPEIQEFLSHTKQHLIGVISKL